MAGVSVGFAKCFMLFMAVVILAQGVIYLGLSIWGLITRGCQETTSLADNPFKFAMELIYFADQDCGDPILTLQGQSITLEMEWEKSKLVTNREYIFMITYAVISGLWIASSALIIMTLCFTTTKLISGIIYWPWFLSVLAGCILDVTATVFHALDITHTTSLDDAFNFVGAKLPADLPNDALSLLNSFGVYFGTPALVLTLLSCRVVLIWLLNLIGGMFCLSLSHVLAKQSAEPNATIIQPMPRGATPQPAVFVEQVQQPTAPYGSTMQLAEEELQYPEQIRPKPLPLIIPAANGEMMQRQDSRYQPSDRMVQSPVLVLPPPQQQQQQPQSPQFQAQPQVSPVYQPDINTYRNTDAHPDQLNYPTADPNTPRVTSPAAQQLASGSALNSRYSDIYATSPPNPRVSEELRNQMPWSYTSMITKPPPPPRKPQQQVQIYPQIPEPDYAEQ